MSSVQIEVVDWLASEPLRAIRQRVFIDEQKVPAELEWDDQDALATHFLLTVDGQPIGTARLLADGHIGRVAILQEARGSGFGQTLMRGVMDHARQQEMRKLVLAAQTHALAFYRRLGFETCSEVYLDAGIPHQDMSWEAQPD